MKTFLLSFGDFNDKSLLPIDYFIFILAIMALPLVLMNMLIAVMTDTFDRVKEEQARRDLQEMAELVYRYETIMDSLCMKKKRKNPWRYIFVSEEVKHEGDEIIEKWQGRIKGIKLELMRMQIINSGW